jgi:hypothetical protein
MEAEVELIGERVGPLSPDAVDVDATFGQARPRLLRIATGLVGAESAEDVVHDTPNTVTMPNVTMTPAGRLLLFTGFRANEAVVGAATSADGIDWTCAGIEPIVTRDDIPGSEGIHTVELFERASGPTLLIESLGDTTSDIWLAELDLP